MELVLRFCSSRKSLLDHNLTSSFAGTSSIKMVLNVWSLDTSKSKVLGRGDRILYIANDTESTLNRPRWLKTPGIFWFWGQMCPNFISGFCFPLLPFSSGSFPLPFSSILSDLLALDFIFLHSHILGKNGGCIYCAFGGRKEQGRGKEKSERRERRGQKESRVQACISFSPEIPKKVCLLWWPCLGYVLILDSSPMWE